MSEPGTRGCSGGLLQYLRRDRPTDGSDSALQRQTNHHLFQSLILTSEPADLRQNLHPPGALDVFALQRGQGEWGLRNRLEQAGTRDRKRK